MSFFHERDSVSGGRRQGSRSSQPTPNAPWSTSSSSNDQSTSTPVPASPPPVRWSTSSGPIQGAYSQQGSLSQQGSAPWGTSSSSSQSTSTRVLAFPPPVGWSPSSGPTQGPYPLQGSLSQRGNSSQQDNFTRSENGVFLGGYMQQGNATSPSASAFTRSDSISHTNGFASQEPQFVPPDLEHNDAYNWFVAIDQDGNRELSPEELQSALLNNGGTRFSTKTINYLMSVFDLDGNGVIGFEEFEPLWDHMKRWRELFESFDADNNGRIDINELGSALTNYGLGVDSSVLELLMKKYGIAPLQNRYSGYGYPPLPQLDLDHFVCALVVVERMCGLYDEYYARGHGQRQLSRDGFLLEVISLP
ncbi:hypothetical protein BJV74DRAFT_264055 [Russula compacta]|nr:hypothetical protein BJV74DRAFT_264055 [Russula compacta]